jgi:translocation and assembly module TamB
MKKRIVIIVSILLLLMVSTLWWLCYTQSGLRFVLAQLDHVPKTSIKVDGVSGTLAGPLHIDLFELDDDYVHVSAKQIDLDLNPALLLSGWVALRGTIYQAAVTLKQHTHSTNNTPINFLPHFLHVYASSLVIHHASFTHYNGFNIEAAPVNARLRLNRRHLVLTRLDAQGEWFTAQGEFHLDSGSTLTLDSQLDATLKPGRSTPLRGKVGMKGSTTELNFIADIQQPNIAHATATLSFPNQTWLISGQAQSARWLLDPWLHNPPLSFSKGIFDYTLDDAGLHIKGDIGVPEWAVSPLHVDADAQFTKQNAKHVIVLKRADISERVSHTQTRTTGAIILTDSLPQLDLKSSWQHLQWPVGAKPEQAYFQSEHGAATLQGSMPYQFEVEADVNTTGVASSTVAASGTLATDHLNVSQFNWQTWKGTLHGTAQLGFEKPRHWQFDVQAHDVDPAGLINQWPGAISFTAQGSGADVNNIATDFDISLHHLGGTLRKQPVHGQGRITRHAREWLADNLNVHWGAASLTVDGRTGIQNDVRVHLDAPTLQYLDTGIQGQLTLQGSLQGTREQPHVTVQLQSSTLTYKSWNSTGLGLNADVDLSDETASHLSLSAKQIGYGNNTLSQLSINAQGQASSHELTLQAMLDTPISDQQQLKMNVHGQYADKEELTHKSQIHQIQWIGKLTQLDVLDKQLRAALDHPAEFRFDRDMQQKSVSLALRDLCIHVDDGHACASGEWQNDGQWQAQASINQLPLALEHTAANEVTRLNAVVNASVDLHQKVDQPWLGDAKLDINNGVIRYQLADHEEALPITLGTAQINADTHTATASASLHIASDTVSEFSAIVNRGNDDIEDWPLHGNFTLRSEDAKVIPIFVHEVDRAGGALTSEVNIAGTLGTPLLDGNVKLSNGELDFYRWNLSLRELQLNAQLNDDQLQFTAQGNAGQGALNASGNFQWRSQLDGKLQLSGNNLLLADSPEYHVLATPNLTFNISQANGKGNIAVSGDVLIPSAKLQPQAITNAVQVSADARFKDDQLYGRDSSWRVDSDVKVKLGDDVRFDGMGLQGQLNGEVTTRLRTAAVATGRGEFGIDDGHYEAYGRKLDIKRGRLLFDNTPLDNPGLDIQAERVINDVNLGDITVGLNVRGFLRDPRLQFYSDPSMSQTQIVSYLVIGKPFDQLQGQETTTVRSATSSLALQGGSYLAGQLGRRIGLEEAGVETDANNQSAFVLGKFLSPRLYVSYGISLTQAINTLKLRYSVSKHWTIKTEAGEAKSADVEFKIDR